MIGGEGGRGGGGGGEGLLPAVVATRVWSKRALWLTRADPVQVGGMRRRRG